MLCRDSKKLLGAYVDNELDVVQSAALEEHLAVCADCQAFVEDQRSVKGLLQQGNFRFSVPSGFYEQIRKSLEPSPSRKLRVWPVIPAWAWKLGTGAATAAALALAIALGVVLHQQSNAGQVIVQNEVVDNHVRSMLLNHLADVDSTDQHTVKPWFNGKLSFSPKVTDFSDKGFPLVGGRLDTMEGETVAALVYKRRQHVINVFTCPHAEVIAPVATEQRGYHIVHWADGGMEYWAISDVNAGELQQFADLLRH